jgi:imidazolonepropionase-like amidohydrolase
VGGSFSESRSFQEKAFLLRFWGMKIVLRNCFIIDGTGLPPQEGDLLIVDGLIKAVGSIAPSELVKADLTLDGKRQWVLPGFINCHLHLTADASANSLQAMKNADSCEATILGVTVADRVLRGGITTARDLGAKNYEAIAIREAVQQGRISGPTLLVAGRALLMTGGHFLGQEVDGVDACLAGARTQVKFGADLIKVVATGGLGKTPGAQELTCDEMKACFGVALKAGMTCAAHAHGASGIKDAVRAGVSSIEHGTMLDDEAMDMMSEQGTYLVPTFSAYSLIAKNGEKMGVPRPVVDSSRWIMEEKQPRFEKALEKGVPVAFGTDGGSPINPHENIVEECLCMSEAGMSPMDVILSLTRNASRLLRLDNMIGTLEVGKQADVLLIGGNPLDDIRQLSNILVVIKKGRLANTYPDRGFKM